MSNIECIIVEDEPLAVKVLVDYISKIPFLHLQGTFKDALSALDHLRTHSIDLIFLDIHLPKLKGMDFLKSLKDPPEIIITSAYHQYAVEGFTLNVTDYIMKPIEFDRFVQAVQKVKVKRLTDRDELKDYLFIYVKKKRVRVLFSEILYIESQREYVKIVTHKEELKTRISTQEIVQILPEDKFKRIHRSYIVAVDKIEAYTLEYLEIRGATIPVGRRYRYVLEGMF